LAEIHKHYSDADVVSLITAYPLALLVSCGPGGFAATPLPMLADTDGKGRLVRLVGHMALANPQVTELHEAPRAWFLFQGPQGYISPRLLPDRNWAPTWNYALVRVTADVRFRPDLNDTALRRLVAVMEAGQPGAWSVEELGERYPRMAQRIVAFDADVVSVDATFKLGQDERPQNFQSILDGLENAELAEWMRRFNPPPG